MYILTRLDTALFSNGVRFFAFCLMMVLISDSNTYFSYENMEGSEKLVDFELVACLLLAFHFSFFRGASISRLDDVEVTLLKPKVLPYYKVSARSALA